MDMLDLQNLSEVKTYLTTHLETMGVLPTAVGVSSRAFLVIWKETMEMIESKEVDSFYTNDTGVMGKKVPDEIYINGVAILVNRLMDSEDGANMFGDVPASPSIN